MANWKGSTRRVSLPPNWSSLREKCFRRDGYQCTAENANTGERCTSPAEECDHVGDRYDHSLANLASLCSWHHGQKSGKQGADSLHRRRQTNLSRFRRDTVHPADFQD